MLWPDGGGSPLGKSRLQWPIAVPCPSCIEQMQGQLDMLSASLCNQHGNVFYYKLDKPVV